VQASIHSTARLHHL